MATAIAPFTAQLARESNDYSCRSFHLCTIARVRRAPARSHPATALRTARVGGPQVLALGGGALPDPHAAAL